MVVIQVYIVHIINTDGFLKPTNQVALSIRDEEEYRQVYSQDPPSQGTFIHMTNFTKTNKHAIFSSFNLNN